MKKKKYDIGGVLSTVSNAALPGSGALVNMFMQALQQGKQPDLTTTPLNNNNNLYGLRDGGDPGPKPKTYPSTDIYQKILSTRPPAATLTGDDYNYERRNWMNKRDWIPKDQLITQIQDKITGLNEDIHKESLVLNSMDDRINSYHQGVRGENTPHYAFSEYLALHDVLDFLEGTPPANKYEAKPETRENNAFTPDRVLKASDPQYPTSPRKGYYEEGGKIQPNGFKQYNSPSHEMGGENIDKTGAIDPNGSNEIEGKENKYTYNLDGSTYVFSDKNGTSEKVRSIMNKYKNKNTDHDMAAKTSMEMEIKGVEKLNEAMKTARDAVSNVMQARYGKQLAYGGDPVLDNTQLTTDNQIDLVNGPHMPADKLYNMPAYDSNSVSPLNPLPSLPLPSSIQSQTAKTPGSEFSPMNVNPSNLNLSGLDLPSILRTAGFVGSGIDALQKPAVEETILPDYSKSDARFNSMNADLTQARQDVTAGANRASELNRNASSSYSQYRGREINNIGNLQDAVSKIGVSEQQLRNQIAGQQGQYEATKAATNAQITDNTNQRNLANTARTQDLRKQFLVDIVGEADRQSFSKDIKNISKAKIQEGMQILKQIAPDFSINESFVTNLIKVSKGELDVSKLSNEELLLFNKLNP